MTLAEYRQTVAQSAHTGEHAHPSPAEYVRIGIILSVITGIEIGLYYIDMATAGLIAILLVLSTAKFGLVVAWFMHLRFDNRLFSFFFVGGLALAFALYIVVLSVLDAGLT